MKNLFLAITLLGAHTLTAQRGKAPIMAPVLTKGYYVSLRNDTLRGKVQVNPPHKTDFYAGFSFKKQRANKPKPIDTRAAKAYGFDGRNFEMITYNGKKMFAERIVSGRLELYEYRVTGKQNDDAIQCHYFIRDKDADESLAELRDLKEISGKFYKKHLKPYMQDQPMVWDQLDKYNFDRNQVIGAVEEFNRFYKPASSR
jgi:hypothetical protein